MQVTDVKSKITHAVVGGKQNEIESFGMEDSAEFFHLLSNALYSNKRLASVREPLCNAWDGHIAAGTTHIPIEITVKDSTLTIADKGTGIARDMIKSIYGTYGRSTKKSDLLSTGGFGLGSKAPFSYVDHFEVTSCHGGEKTIYRMSLSNAQVGGKPSIIPIMTVPTTETGLTVSFKLKPGDEEKFKMIIMSVVSAGEMNANLNGIPIMTRHLMASQWSNLPS
jgi:HSP90 family molecular chaperone